MRTHTIGSLGLAAAAAPTSAYPPAVSTEADTGSGVRSRRTQHFRVRDNPNHPDIAAIMPRLGSRYANATLVPSHTRHGGNLAVRPNELAHVPAQFISETGQTLYAFDLKDITKEQMAQAIELANEIHGPDCGGLQGQERTAAVFQILDQQFRENAMKLRAGATSVQLEPTDKTALVTEPPAPVPQGGVWLPDQSPPAYPADRLGVPYQPPVSIPQAVYPYPKPPPPPLSAFYPRPQDVLAPPPAPAPPPAAQMLHVYTPNGVFQTPYRRIFFARLAEGLPVILVTVADRAYVGPRWDPGPPSLDPNVPGAQFLVSIDGDPTRFVIDWFGIQFDYDDVNLRVYFAAPAASPSG